MAIDKNVLKKSIDNSKSNDLHTFHVIPTEKDSGKKVTSEVAKLLAKNPSATVVVILH